MPTDSSPCLHLRLAAALLAIWICGGDLLAQPPGFVIPADAPPQVREAMERARNRRGGRPQPPQPNADEKQGDAKSDEEKKDEGDKKDNESDGDKKPESVTRPDEPPRPPDPRELEATPDENGRITFSFHGQAWADVLEWLAKVSKLSLDWRELPSDYLNLSTQRSYTLPEARDLINRHLQARGYTLLLSGEVLSVFKLGELEPSLVPRITEEELYDRQPHDVVKLSLETPPGIDPKQAVEDVKQALSPHAKVMPLPATGRLLMIDNVANLRMVSGLLNSERMAAEGREQPREFVLRYIQAPQVIDTLYVVLGLDPNSRPSQMELRMQQQKMELMQQMARSGKDVMSLMKKDGPPVYLAYNRQRNSILANAPEAEMRIIARTIDALDVPAGGGVQPLSGSMSDRQFKSYRLKTIEPLAVIETIRQIGDLSPLAELEGDNKSKTLFARATEADHEKIASLVEQLDGAETEVEVFWLRRLPAEAVAGSIQELIINKPKEAEDNSRRRRRWWQPEEEEEESDTILRVDADTENNRLIARGTPQQLDEVRDLLVKLGEPIGDRPDQRRVRVFDALTPEDTARLLERLGESWSEVGEGNELVLPPERSNEPDDERESEESSPPRTAQTISRFRLLSDSTGDEAPGANDEPPITVRVDRSGRIVLRSDDIEALNRLEALIDDLAPAPKRYEVFRVTNRSPDDIVLSLETYFREFLAEDDDPDTRFYRRIFGMSEEEETVKLSQRRPLRFLADDWSSTILVANATPDQLSEIGRLIKAWDRQPIDDRVITRRTATIKLQYAKASSVVSALKEVYRDLLSRSDKEFDTNERKASLSSTRYLTQIQYGVDGASEPAFIGFDGLMSLGSDDAANVVIVSAREEVFDTIVGAIDDLDRQARPTASVEVVSVSGGVAMPELQAALARALATGASGNAQAANQPNNDRRGRDRGRGRGRRGR